MNIINRQSEPQRIAHLKAQQESGLSVMLYCQRHQISKQSFYLWRKKYDVVLNSDHPANDFVSINIEEPHPEESNAIIAQIQHPNGCVISFYKDCTPSFLSQTIQQL